VGSADRFGTDVTAFKSVVDRLKVVVVEGATHQGPQGIVDRPEFLPTVRAFLAEQHVR
jgi:hypothetical protein